MTYGEEGGSGSGSASDNLSEAEIVRIATADFQNVSRMRTQSEGWGEAQALGEYIKSLLKSKREAYLGGKSQVLTLVTGQIELMEAGAGDAADAAEGNSLAMTDLADEADSFYHRIEALSGDAADMDGMSDAEKTEEFGSMAGPGEDGFALARKSVLDDMRVEIDKTEQVYEQSWSARMDKPPEYRGLPEWTGPEPVRTPGLPAGASGLNGNPVGQSETSGYSNNHGPSPTNSNGDPGRHDGPQLQNPGGGVSPNLPAQSTLPGPAIAPTQPVGGSGPMTMPVAPNGIPGGTRPITPPISSRPSGGMPPAARGTPGMGAGRTPITTRPPMGGTPGRNISGGTAGRGGMPSRGTAVPSKADRALLPSQRNAGRSANRTTKPVKPTSASQPFVKLRKTVKPVIGQRGSTATPQPTRSDRAVPRAAGKVIGQRPNKTAKTDSPKPPPLKRGILTKQGIAGSRSGSRHWTHQPQRKTGAVEQGRVIGERASKNPQVTADSKRRQRQAEISRKRHAILDRWRQKQTQPEHPVTDGLDLTALPAVLRPHLPQQRFSRRDVGPVFGNRGWETGE